MKHLYRIYELIRDLATDRQPTELYTPGRNGAVRDLLNESSHPGWNERAVVQISPEDRNA